MKGLSILIIIAAGVLAAGALQADIYEWTDENGVKHFTNYAPPDNATILIKTEEFPYDEAADRARVEADKQFQLELTRLELAEREAELERREAEAVRRAAEAERYADDTVRAADQYLEDTRNDRWYYRGGSSWGGYLAPRYGRSFYRNETASIYWLDRPYIDHYRPKYRVKRPGHPGETYLAKPFRHTKQAYPQKYQSPHYLRSAARRPHSAFRVNSQSRGQIGSRQLSRGSFGRLR